MQRVGAKVGDKVTVASKSRRAEEI